MYYLKKRGIINLSLVVFVLLALLIIFSFSACGESNIDIREKFEKRTYNDSNTSNIMPYRLYVPQNYSDKISYPVVIFLHGSGERGMDNELQLTFDGATMWGSSKNQEKHPCFVIAPQCPLNKQWVNTPWSKGSFKYDDVKPSDQLKMVKGIIDKIQFEYNIDPCRIYLTGISMGGYGAWCMNIMYPNTFAAIVPICGGSDPSKAYAFKDKAVWAFHGDNDKVVPVFGTRDMIKAIKECGGDPKYNEYSGVGHGSWFKAYEEPGLVDWFFSQRKISLQ